MDGFLDFTPFFHKNKEIKSGKHFPRIESAPFCAKIFCLVGPQIHLFYTENQCNSVKEVYVFNKVTHFMTFSERHA